VSLDGCRAGGRLPAGGAEPPVGQHGSRTYRPHSSIGQRPAGTFATGCPSVPSCGWFGAAQVVGAAPASGHAPRGRTSLFEFEHGSHDPQTDVTGDDPILTGKVALAHMKEFPDYYERLERMEAEAERDWAAKKS